MDDGDSIEVTFGLRAQAQEVVEKKQLMEAIALIQRSVEPVTGIQRYDDKAPMEELYRTTGLGKPKLNDGPMAQLQQMVTQMRQQIISLGGEDPLKPQKKNKESSGGPRPSEGDGPQQGTLNAGALRGTVPQTAGV